MYKRQLFSHTGFNAIFCAIDTAGIDTDKFTTFNFSTTCLLYTSYTNPLRVLDSKNPEVQALLNDAPALGDYLDEDSRAHFAGLCALLDLSLIHI